MMSWSTQLIEASTAETLALAESNPRCLPHFLMTHQKYDDDDDDDDNYDHDDHHYHDDDDDDDDVDYSSVQFLLGWCMWWVW